MGYRESGRAGIPACLTFPNFKSASLEILCYLSAGE
jgi:hypothetical protein